MKFSSWSNKFCGTIFQRQNSNRFRPLQTGPEQVLSSWNQFQAGSVIFSLGASAALASLDVIGWRRIQEDSGKEKKKKLEPDTNWQKLTVRTCGTIILIWTSFLDNYIYDEHSIIFTVPIATAIFSVGQTNLWWGAAVAQWIRLHLTSCRPGFESSYAFIKLYLNCDMYKRRK